MFADEIENSIDYIISINQCKFFKRKQKRFNMSIKFRFYDFFFIDIKFGRYVGQFE